MHLQGAAGPATTPLPALQSRGQLLMGGDGGTLVQAGRSFEIEEKYGLCPSTNFRMAMSSLRVPKTCQ